MAEDFEALEWHFRTRAEVYPESAPRRQIR